MHYSSHITTLLATVQTFLDYSPLRIPPSSNYQLSSPPEPQLKVLNLGLHPIIATEFGARASALLHHKQHPHHQTPSKSIGKAIMVALSSPSEVDAEDGILCSSVVINNQARMELKTFDEARHAFCAAFNGTKISAGLSLSSRIQKVVNHSDRDRSSQHVVGSSSLPYHTQVTA